MTFYDAMLPDITTDERMDAVSSSGYAWGYIGSTVPFIICLALIMGGPALGVPTMLATRLSFVITGAWWLIFTLPLIRTYKQKYGRERGPQDTIGHIVGGVFSEVGHTMREIAHNKTVLVYMIAFFFYIDGVHTVISMATSYGSALGIDSTTGAGAARYAVCGLPVRHHLRQARRSRGHAQHDHGGRRRLHGHRALCRVFLKDRL